MKKYLILVSTVIAVIALGCTTKSVYDSATVEIRSPQDQNRLQKSVTVSIPTNRALMEKGLGGRTALGDEEGMWFDFSPKQTVSFWMKDMRIPIDIIWISDATIVGFERNAQAPAAGARDKDLKLYSPTKPVDHVLEVSAGFVDKHHIALGDTVVLGSKTKR